MKRKAASSLSLDYGKFLADIKARVRAAQIRAGLAANRKLLSLYWDLGRMILSRQKAQGWGAKVIDCLSQDLQHEFPGQQGFSPRNLKYMRAFAAAWPEAAFVQQPAAQIPWTHHCMLLDKVGKAEDRLWYAALAIEHGWSRNVLALLDFYLSAVDDRFRQQGDRPSIGLILCRAKNRIIAEYALHDLRKPIGISGYVTRLLESLPKKPASIHSERGGASDRHIYHLQNLACLQTISEIKDSKRAPNACLSD